MKAEKQSKVMRPEYNFSKAVRGKYLRAYTQSSNVVVLAPDVAARFKNARTVNEALRAVLKAAEQARLNDSQRAPVHGTFRRRAASFVRGVYALGCGSRPRYVAESKVSD